MPCLDASLHNGDECKGGDCLLQPGEGIQSSACHEIAHFSSKKALSTMCITPGDANPMGKNASG
eukprot:4701268-Lingulodinium_polyedra.AAC.1